MKKYFEHHLTFPLSPLCTQDEVYMDGPYVCGRGLWHVWDGDVDPASQRSAL